VLVATSTVLIEQRLRSTNLTIVLGIAIVVLANVVVLVVNATSVHSLPVLAVLVLAVGFAIVLFFFVVSLRVVVRVVDDARGRRLEILYGPGGVMRQRFDRTDIESASAENLTLMQMGGWGYRGSLRLFHRAALVTRRGEALALTLRGNRRFVITVDVPTHFVEALSS
jgi:hypothetical protein